MAVMKDIEMLVIKCWRAMACVPVRLAERPRALRMCALLLHAVHALCGAMRGATSLQFTSYSA